MLGCMSAHAGRPFQPEALDGQRVKFDSGTGSVSSLAERSFVRIYYSPEAGCCGWLSVYVANIGVDPVDVSEQSASVASNGKDLHVFTFAEVQKKLRRSARWAMLGAGLASGLNSYNAGQAGYSSQSGTFAGQVETTSTGSGGYSRSSSSVDGTYSGTTYDSAAAFQAQSRAAQENQELFTSVEQRANERAVDAHSRLLQRTTVDPGEDIFGDIEIEIPRPIRRQVVSFTVKIQVGSDVHEFKFVEAE